MLAKTLAMILELCICRLIHGPRENRRVLVVVEAKKASVLPPATDVVAEYNRGVRVVSPELLTSADVVLAIFSPAETCYKPNPLTVLLSRAPNAALLQLRRCRRLYAS